MDSLKDSNDALAGLSDRLSEARGKLGFALLLTVVVMLWLGTDLVQSCRVHWYGLTTEGTVTRLWIGSGRGSTHRMIDFAFQVGGSSFQGSEWVSEQLFRASHVGDKLEVHYLPSSPSRNELVIGGSLQTSAQTFFIVGMFLSVLVVGAGNKISVLGKMIRVRKLAFVKSAVVEGCKADKWGRGRITWRDPSGATGESLWRKLESPPPIGSQITIYADPSGRLPSVWEGDCGPR